MTDDTIEDVKWTDTIPALPTPTRTGYIFDDWYYNTTLVEQGDYFRQDIGDVDAPTLVATWTEDTYTLTLDYNGGKDADDTRTSTTHDYLWTATITPADASKYSFASWQYDGSNLPISATDGTATFGDIFGVAMAYSTTNTVELQAHYAVNFVTVNYMIPFDANGNFDENGFILGEAFQVGSVDTLTIAKNNVHKPFDGYTFLGWYTTTGFTQTVAAAVDPNDITPYNVFDDLDATCYIYGQYVENEYTITYNLNYTTTDTIADGVYKWTGEVDLPDQLTREGYTFTGWYETASGENIITDGSHYSDTFGTIFDSNITVTDGKSEGTGTVYAGWSANTYTVHYSLNSNGEATGKPDTQTLTWGATINTVTAPERTGYSFVGWNTDVNTTTALTLSTYAALATYDTVSTVILYAIWSADAYTVTYDEQGGTATPAIVDPSVAYNATFTLADAVAITSNQTLFSEIMDDDSITTFSLRAWWTESTPDTVAVDYSTERLTNLVPGATYIINGVDYDAIGSGYIEIDESWLGETITIVKEAIGSYTFDSAAYQLTLDARPNAPTSTLVAGTYTGAQAFKLACEGAYETIYYCILEHNESDSEDNDGWIADSILSNFGLIRIDDDTPDDDDIVTDAERDYLYDAMPSGYSEVSAFQLHATVNDEVILDTVELASRVTIVIELDNMSSRQTYQVLHMKHGADGSDDVEIFSTSATDPDLLLVADYTAKTLTLSVDSLSPFMVVSKTNYTSSKSSTTSTSTTAVLDTENHFAYMQGYADGTFRPDNNITRAQAIVMFSRLLTEQMDSDTTYTSSFSDVTSDLWYANAVGFMEQYGIITGYSDGTFRGDSYITRAQFAAIASRFDELVTTGDLPFSDVEESHWASDYISSASAKGWITGYTDGTFRPDQYITRAQAVTMVNRVLERSCDQDFVADNLDDLTTYTDVSDGYWAYYNILEATNGHDYTISDGVETWSNLK